MDEYCAEDTMPLHAMAGIPATASADPVTLLGAAVANLAAFQVSHPIIRHDPLFGLIVDQVQRARAALRGDA